MNFSDIVGHQKIIQALKDSDPGQAYLFSGPSGVGKKLVALAFAHKILKSQKQNNPDILLFSTDDALIKVEDVRQIQQFVNLKSFSGGGKVVIINDAQKMNPQAANSLLKTLEEPPTGCHFILVTSNKGSMLSTILSRCQKFQFGNLSVEELKKISPDSPSWALELCQGRVDLLQKWADPTKKELRDLCLQIFRDLPEARTYEGFEKVDELSEDKDTAFFATVLWQHWLKQVCLIQLGEKAKGSADEIQTFKSLSGKIKNSGVLKMSRDLIQLESDIVANVNRRLAFENFFLGAKNYLI